MAGLLDSLLERIGTPFDRLRRERPSADHVANRLVELLPLPLDEKQHLFDTEDAVRRLQRLAGLISPEQKT
jgi:Lon protease-like protein